MKKAQRFFPYSDSLLLVLISFTVFIVPVLPISWHHILYPFFFSGVLLSAIFSIQKSRQILLTIALGLVILVWVAFIADLENLVLITRSLQIVFLLVIVVELVWQTAASKEVTKKVIVDSITGYLLLGFAFSLLVIIVATFDPDAFRFPGDGASNKEFRRFADYIYFTFTSFTTMGYGDITPVSPISKSLAILIGISGQLYVATIIAMLVGKYASTRND